MMLFLNPRRHRGPDPRRVFRRFLRLLERRIAAPEAR